MIPLRTGGSEPPLFLAHEISGEVFYGARLAPHLAPGFPVYGLPAPDLSEAHLRTLQAMATRAVKIIRAVQPEGPYRIAGWSFGGILAYEIATQLIGADASVEFLGSLDGGYFGPEIKILNEEQSEMTAPDGSLLLDLFGGDTGLHPIQRASSDPGQNFDTWARAGQERPPAREEQSIDQTRRIRERTRSHWLAARQYTAYPIPIPLRLFAAEEAKGISALRNWELILPAKQIQFIPVPGTHHSMMESSRIAALGKAVSQALRQARESKPPQPEKEYRPLLSIHDGNKGVPIICVPGAGSTAISFLDLADSLKNIGPVEGVQPRGVEGTLVPHATVPAAARAYLQFIRPKYPDGPIHLLGHSFGGWVAFEMARLLREDGRAVASLTILDSAPPDIDDTLGPEYSRTEAVMELVELYEQIAQCSLEIQADQIDALDPLGQLELLSARLVQKSLMPRQTQPADLIGAVRTFETSLRARYHPESVFPGPALLVLAHDPKKDQQANRENFDRRAAEWRRWAPNLTVWSSPGSHMTMLRQPHVAALSNWLSTMLSMTKS